MSMNLAFKTVQGNYIIDFPYQTPTDITRAVLAARTTTEQLKFIKEDLLSRVDENDSDDVNWYNDLVQEVEDKLTDETLILIMT